MVAIQVGFYIALLSECQPCSDSDLRKKYALILDGHRSPKLIMKWIVVAFNLKVLSFSRIQAILLELFEREEAGSSSLVLRSESNKNSLIMDA